MPSVPSATTVNPITAPLENATRNALERLEVAACVVRTAALVAVCMPTHPAVAERTAPARNATPVNSALPGSSSTSATNMTPTKPANTVYSVFKKAIAPLRISAAMRCIRSVPGSRRLIRPIRKNAKAAAATGIPNPST